MLRLARAMRAGRVARRWPALRTVGLILVRSMSSLAPILLLLLLFLFVAALLGMQVNQTNAVVVVTFETL